MRRPTLRQTLCATALLAWAAANGLAAWLLPPVPRQTLPVSYAEANAQAFSPDGRWLVTSGFGGLPEPVRLWDVEIGTARVIHLNVPKPPERLLSMRFSADGRRLVWDDAGNVVHLFDVESEREAAEFRWPDG